MVQYIDEARHCAQNSHQGSLVTAKFNLAVTLMNMQWLQVIRWLQLRGRAIESFHFSTPTMASSEMWPQLRDASMSLLPLLPNLQYLGVSAGHDFMVPERHLHLMQLLPDLQHLELSLESDGTWNESTLEPLEHLRALTSLDLMINDMMGPLLLSPALAELTQLEDLCLWCVGGSAESGQARLMQIVSKLTGLQALQLNNMVESIPTDLGRLTRLTYLELRSLSFEDPLHVPPVSFGLCTKLRHICLSFLDNISDEAWQHVCRALQRLPCLDVLEVESVDLSGVQPCTWVLPSSLTSLHLDVCGMSIIPGAVCCLPYLKDLSMSDPYYGSSSHDVQLASLPRGPYLHSLVSLGLNGPKAGAGPEALIDAECLRFLRVQARRDTHLLWATSALQQLVPKGCVIEFREDG